MVYTDGMFFCGTSGFSRDDWVGGFCAAGVPGREWLANNHWHRQSVRTIRQLRILLD
jgi:hypothetical protein